MTLPLRRAPADRLYRVHRTDAHANELTSWAHASPRDGRFDGRFDDPDPQPGTRWRALYLATSPVCAVAEALQITKSINPEVSRLRTTFAFDDAEDERTQKPDPPETKVLEKISRSSISAVALAPDATFVPLMESSWLMYLRERMCDTRAKSDPIKLGELLGYEVDFSRAAAALIRTAVEHAAGLIVPSSLGAEFTNVVLFEDAPESGCLRVAAWSKRSQPLALDDPLVQTGLRCISQVPITADDLRVDSGVDQDRESRFSIEIEDDDDDASDDALTDESSSGEHRVLKRTPAREAPASKSKSRGR